jgi:hypothetical protein
VFADFCKGFDSVPRHLQFARLEQLGFSTQYLQLLQHMYAHAHVSFSVPGGLSQPISTDVGVLQGDPLSPTLFGVYIDCVIRYMLSHCSEVATPLVQQHLVHGLLYADDLVLLSLSAESAQLQLNALAGFCAEFGLSVNLGKSAHVAFRGPRRRRVGVRLSYRGQEWPVQEQYRYLGLTFSSTKGIMGSIADLERAGRRAALATLSRCRQLHISDLRLALSLFNNQVLPCLTYTLEVWLPCLTADRVTCKMLTSPEEGIHQCLERVQLCFIKRFLGLRASTPHWVTLAESSRLPVYMFAYKRVCRYWNKLAQLGDRHLARLVLEESHQMHTIAKPTWAGLVLQLGSDLRVAPRCVPHEREHAWEATWHPPPDQPDIVVSREFCMREVARACSRCLEDWWCQWRSGVDNSSQLQLYGRLFLHREHLDTDNNYL